MSNIYNEEYLKKLNSDPSRVLIIYYSNFENNYEPFSSAISSIVIRSLDKSIYQCFSIHLEADLSKLDIETIEDEYIDLEYMVLLKFSKFLKNHKEYTWIHWNMNNIEYGFEALKHRFDKLSQGSNEQFEEVVGKNKFDLNNFFEIYFGENYSTGPDKLKSLMEFNNIDDQGSYLTQRDEGAEFLKKNYRTVIKSVDFKVTFISQLPTLFENKILKIPKKNKYRKFINFISHPITSFVGLIIGLIIGLLSSIK